MESKVIYFTREGNKIDYSRYEHVTSGCGTRHCTNVQCCRVAWFFLLFLLLLGHPPGLYVPVGHHGDKGVLLPSAIGIEHGLHPVVVHGEDVLLLAMIESRHVPLLASVGGEHSLLIVPVDDEYVL